MPGSNHPVVVRSNSKTAHLIWMNSGVISTVSWASCLAARVVPKSPKALGAQAVLAVLAARA